MAFLEWDDSFSVKVGKIDNQHHELVNMLNNLNDAMKTGKSKDNMSGILDNMVDYAAVHFALEEKYFDQFNYLKAFAHRKEHAKFVKKVMEFKDGFDNGHMMLSLDVMSFLKEWLVSHINGIDKDYTQCFNENGLH